MSQAKIDQYKQEKANRKSNVKKAKTKKKLGLIGGISAGVVVAGVLIWGIVATVQDGGLTKNNDKKKELENQQIATQEFIEFMNSQNTQNTDGAEKTE